MLSSELMVKTEGKLLSRQLKMWLARSLKVRMQLKVRWKCDLKIREMSFALKIKPRQLTLIKNQP